LSQVALAVVVALLMAHTQRVEAEQVDFVQLLLLQAVAVHLKLLYL
jgi:hypothetical protein